MRDITKETKNRVDAAGRVRGFIAPGTAIAVVLVEVLVGLSEIRRPLFIALSAVALLITIGLAVWYLRMRDLGRAAAAGTGAALVLFLAITGAPSSTLPTQSTTSQNGQRDAEVPSPQPSFDEPEDEVVVEQPSEAAVLFGELTNGWRGMILNMFPSATVEDAEGEAAVMGSWWAAADWCRQEGHGSEGRCYDLAALYHGRYFDRDPRTMSADNWGNAGAILSVVIIAYETTAHQLGFKPQWKLAPELLKDRPGVDWFCEPTCVAGALR